MSNKTILGFNKLFNVLEYVEDENGRVRQKIDYSAVIEMEQAEDVVSQFMYAFLKNHTQVIAEGVNYPPFVAVALTPKCGYIDSLVTEDDESIHVISHIDGIFDMKLPTFRQVIDFNLDTVLVSTDTEDQTFKITHELINEEILITTLSEMDNDRVLRYDQLQVVGNRLIHTQGPSLDELYPLVELTLVEA